MAYFSAIKFDNIFNIQNLDVNEILSGRPDKSVKKIFSTLILFVFLVAPLNSSFAFLTTNKQQPTNAVAEQGNEGKTTNDAPIGNGLWILLPLALGYGALKFHPKRHSYALLKT
jgi:hypothetical protein